MVTMARLNYGAVATEDILEDLLRDLELNDNFYAREATRENLRRLMQDAEYTVKELSSPAINYYAGYSDCLKLFMK